MGSELQVEAQQEERQEMLGKIKKSNGVTRGRTNGKMRREQRFQLCTLF